MVDTLSRSDRTLEGRWWRRDVGGKMIRFVVCRKGDRHVVAARDGDMLVLQRVAPQVGLAGMVTTVLGTATPADVEPLTGVASKLAECRNANQLLAVRHRTGFGTRLRRHHRRPDELGGDHRGRTPSRAAPSPKPDVAAGVLDSRQGRIVSIPRRVNGELYGSFLPGSQENLQRALDGLIEFLPSGSWFDQQEADTCAADEPVRTHARWVTLRHAMRRRARRPGTRSSSQ